MPAGDAARSDDQDRERDRDFDRSDRGGTKSKSSASSASKSKDLSHVPCKFYKVGGCTAGPSCPFSHSVAEPGQKETCAWFIKGNCKFGHKCALAHILPGQTMAMDRKNKKAAQVAANSGAGGDKVERGGKEGKGPRGGKREGGLSSSGAAGTRNPLLAGGSTAPTRILGPSSTGRPPMSVLKASTSPAAPAPPLASLGILGDLDSEGAPLASAPAHGKQSSQDNGVSTAIDNRTTSEVLDNQPKSKPNSPTPLPTSISRSIATPTQPKADFGPIGSPPTSGSLSSKFIKDTTKDDNVTPGTSPQHINGITVLSGSPAKSQSFAPSSPFSAPGHQTTFSGSYTGVGGIASSLSALTMMGSRNGWNEHASSSHRGRVNGDNILRKGAQLDSAVEDADMEDFLPSSLTDLLTPEERRRRMSRTYSGQPPNTSNAPGHSHLMRDNNSAATPGSNGAGHRYSRSVPAPSLLGDVKSIWSDNPNNNGLPSSPSHHHATPSSSFSQRFNPLDNAADDMGLSISVGSASSGMMGLSPSNASGAFLPGLHSQYLNSKAKHAQQMSLGNGLGRGVRGTSGPVYTGNTGTSLSSNTMLGAVQNFATNTGVHTHSNPLNNAQHTYRAGPSPFDLTQQQHMYPQTARPIPSQYPNAGAPNGAGEEHHGPHLLSPSSRALQAHAPGQSLPQGLAAGYSRIHALPPLASPSSAGLFGSGTPPTSSETSMPSSGPYGQWKGAASPPNNNTGFDGMFSRLSYSNAASRGPGGNLTHIPSGQTTGPPPGLSRTVSGGKQSTGPGPLSPLSKPAIPRDDDDDLFSMEA